MEQGGGKDLLHSHGVAGAALTAQVHDNIAPLTASSNPYNFRTFGTDQSGGSNDINTYFLANDGTGSHLYREEGDNDSGKIVTTSGANITVVDDFTQRLMKLTAATASSILSATMALAGPSGG